MNQEFYKKLTVKDHPHQVAVMPILLPLNLISSSSAQSSVAFVVPLVRDPVLYRLFPGGGLSGSTPPLTVEDWIPSEDPKKGDNFCGIDRSIDPIRCAGIRHVAKSNKSILESFGDAVYKLVREGHYNLNRIAFVDSKIFNILAEELNAKPVGNATILLEVVVATAFGMLEVFPDDTMNGYGMIVHHNSWNIFYNHRVGLMNLVCTNPSANCRIIFNTEAIKPAACDCGSEKHGFAAHIRGCPKYITT